MPNGGGGELYEGTRPRETPSRLRADTVGIVLPKETPCLRTVSFPCLTSPIFPPAPRFYRFNLTMTMMLLQRISMSASTGTTCLRFLEETVQISSTLKRLLLLALVVSTFVFEVAAGIKCPDGTDGLTKALYVAGDPSKYADVTCIPEKEFYSYKGGDVVIEGLAYLTSVEPYAFQFSGKVIFKGNFPLLSQIGQEAFHRSGNADSNVELLGELVPKLSTIDRAAFQNFRGTVIVKGSFPLLSQIGRDAFNSVDHAGSKFELVGELPKFTAIGRSAFRFFKGTVVLKGSFPLLSEIGSEAFWEASNADSYVELLGELLPKLTLIGRTAFYLFNGTVILKGRFPLLSKIGEQSFDGGHYDYSDSLGRQLISKAGNADSKVELIEGMPKLAYIGYHAFDAFKGTVIFKGSFPLLSQIGSNTFKNAGNADSKVELLGALVPKLTTLGNEQTFNAFRGTVIMIGPFPMLSKIGYRTFGSGSSTSHIAITCSSPSGLTVQPTAFQGFEGTHDASGELCSCAAACAPCWLPERVVDIKTCTTTSTTTTTTTGTDTGTTTTTLTTTTTTATATTTTTSKTSTTTTYTPTTTTYTYTSTTTTTTRLCNGIADDAACNQMDISLCLHTSALFQEQVRKLCPALCNTCEPATPLPTAPAAASTAGQTEASACICAGIALDEVKGGSDCTSIHDGRPYCYVAAGICPDSVGSKAVAGFHYSYLACQHHVQTNPAPTGDSKGEESGNAALDALHKRPASAGEVVGIVLGVILLCGIVFQIAVQRRAGAGAGAGAGMAADGSTTPERCSNCKAKTQFCACQVRRGTLDMAASKTVTVSSFVNDMYDSTPTSTTAIADDEGLYDEPPAAGYLTVNA